MAPTTRVRTTLEEQVEEAGAADEAHAPSQEAHQPVLGQPRRQRGDDQGDAERAARFLGAAERLFHEVEAAVDPEELETQEAIRKWATEALGADAFEAMRAVGTETPVDELVPVPA